MAQEINDASATKVLVVDKDEVVLNALKEQLPPMGFHVTTVNGETLAKEHLTTEIFGVVIIDGALGVELIELARDLQPDCSRIMLTSGMSIQDLATIIESGLIFRYLSKPWMGNDLHMTLINASERYRMILENKTLRDRNLQLSDQIASGGSGASGEGANGGGEKLALSAMNQMLYTFHPNLGNTALRAEALCRSIGEVMELSSEDSRTLTMAALTHDIGLMKNEVGVVRRWMRDPEKCTDEEMEVIKEHSERAEEILLELGKSLLINPEDSDEKNPYAAIAETVRHHHEHWDGTGYPDRLKGETIPRLSRLLAPVVYYCNQNAADVQLIKFMETELADRVFDPDAVRALVKAVPMTHMPRGEREILLIELKAGMELARPILNTNGMKLLDAGKTLEDRHVNKVHSINRMTPIDPYCLVYC